ncbi:MAG: hypothetical protein U5K84_04125 [Alkalibacterium sp.]|nr:hypothetical protein [Alkalibacterium sp.]
MPAMVSLSHWPVMKEAQQRGSQVPGDIRDVIGYDDIPFSRLSFTGTDHDISSRFSRQGITQQIC